MGSNERKTAFTPNLQGDPFTLYIRRKNLGQRQQKYVNSVKEREGETEIATFEKAIKPDPNFTKAQGGSGGVRRKRKEREKKPISSFSSPFLQ